jgi:molybdopterin converting factor small subunit
MATVHLPSGWSAATDGVVDLAIDVRRVDDLLRALTARFPAIAAELHTIAVAVDGEIHHDPEFVEIGPSSEVYLVPRVSGG